MLRGWEAWSWRRESVQSSRSPGEVFQARLTRRRPWGRPKTCSPLKVLQPQHTCRKGAVDGWMDSTLKKTLSHLPVMCKMYLPINYSQEDSIQALPNCPRGLKTGFHWTFRCFIDNNTDIVLLPCPVWSLWGLYGHLLDHSLWIWCQRKWFAMQNQGEQLLLAVPETFIFTYGYTLAFVSLLNPFINHFIFILCNINRWCTLLLLNNDAASRHDCAGCGSVPHKNQMLRDHLAHLWRFESRNTNSFSVPFIPLLRPWGKEAGIHPGYVTMSITGHTPELTRTLLPWTQNLTNTSVSSLNPLWAQIGGISSEIQVNSDVSALTRETTRRRWLLRGLEAPSSGKFFFSGSDLTDTDWSKESNLPDNFHIWPFSLF